MYEVIVAQKLEVELNNSFFGKKGDEVLEQTKILKLVKNELVEFSWYLPWRDSKIKV